jgi:Xaa-Pro aminopeptidase
MDRFHVRRDKVRQLIERSGLEALLVTNSVNVTYLTGFTGDSSFLLLTRSGEVLLSDARFTTQLAEECPGLDVLIRTPKTSLVSFVARAINSTKAASLGFEAESMTVAFRDRIAHKLPKVALAPTSGLVEKLRMVKDREEISELRRAITQAERAFAVVRAAIRLDQTEKEIADNLDYQMRLFGAKRASFPPIVAVGPRSALPHAPPTEQRIGDGPFVLIDWGADDGLYKSDLTRVLHIARIPPKLQRVYGVVLKAQLAAIKAIRPGATCHDVDAAARSVIEQAGFGRRFGHGLGHGIGLEVHESPRLGPKQKLPLRAGMVVTIEPGVYLPGFGGVRIEDDVLVTKSGHEVLTNVPKQWDEAFVGG